ncbi:hypothetical protein [Streptomyces sp. enrichment culture]|uniref:hypothetical protein n=1 Tax=Streptomyces sp. enrichment culture TaxID=1795815 RepID=UPI003F54DED0
MPEHVSILQWVGVAVLASAAAVCVTGLARVLRRGRGEDTARDPGPTVLPALPRQRQAGPDLESVELTPAERAAFAGLVRQFADGH